MSLLLRLLAGLFLLLVGVTPAFADVSLGLVTGSQGFFRNEDQARRFATYLGDQLATPVVLHRFTDPETLRDWLVRYGEIDLAFLPPTLVATLPRMQAQDLLRLDRPADPGTIYTLVARSGLNPALLQAIPRLAKTPAWPSWLHSATATPSQPVPRPAAGTPGIGYRQWLTDQNFTRHQPSKLPAATQPAARVATPGPPRALVDALTTAERLAAPPVPRALLPAVQPQDSLTLEEREAAPPPTVVPGPPQVVAVAVPPARHPAPPPPAPTLAEATPTEKPAASRVAPLAEAKSQETAATADSPPTPPVADSVPATSALKPVATAPVEATAGPSAKGHHLGWLLGLGLIGLMLAGAVFLARERLQQSKLEALVDAATTRKPGPKSPLPPRETPAGSASGQRKMPAAAAPKTSAPPVRSDSRPPTQGTPAAPSRQARATSDRGGPLNLQGELDAIHVPMLLQMLATHTQPGTLVIHGHHSEKRIHFQEGLISSAVSLNRAKQSTSGFLMNKLGYLLIRQGKISEKQRDQALVYCEAHPRTRIGEALIEIGAIDREALREALKTQAEGVIFSLFIFAEGFFEFIPGDTKLARNDHLDIRITDLLDEAGRHEMEWAKVRRAIPSLDTVLNFAPGGREKLHKARMTVHQRLVLSLIDGQRSIHGICTEATMLDFEVYNFLYLMVHANILEVPLGTATKPQALAR